MVAASRDGRLDVVRAVALLSMFVAHFAPSDGPGGLLGLSEYLTAPLFAALVGWSGELERVRRPGRDRARAVLVRGAVLLVVGLALAHLSSQIIVILPWLGLLVWLTGLLVRLASPWLVVVAAVLVALEPTLLARARDHLVTSTAVRDPSGVVAPRPGQLRDLLVELAAGGEAYRLTWLVPLACLGVLLARHATTGRRPALVGVPAAVGALVLLALGKADVVTLQPYSGRWAELALEALMVAATVLGVRALAGRVPALVAALAPAGAMALSLYVVQVLVSQWWADAGLTPLPGVPGAAGTDNSWVLLALLVVGAPAAAWAWRRALRRTPLARGPLESAVAVLTRPSGAGRAP